METTTGQSDRELVAAWLADVEERYSNDDDRGATIGAKRATVGNLRRALKAGDDITLSQRIRLALKKYRKPTPDGSVSGLALAMIAAVVSLAREDPVALQQWYDARPSLSEGQYEYFERKNNG